MAFFFFLAHNLRVRFLHGVPELSIHVFSKFVTAPFWVVHFCHLVSESWFCFLHSPVCWQDFPLRLLFGSVSFFFPAFLGFTFLRHFFLYWILFWGLVLTYCFILFFVFILLEYILESVEHSYDHSLEFPVGKSFQTVHSYWGPLLWVRHFWRRHVVLVFCVVFVSMLWPVHLKLVESFFFSYFFFFQWRHLQCSGEGYILEVTKSK